MNELLATDGIQSAQKQPFWQTILADSIFQPGKLLELLELSPLLLQGCTKATDQFALKVPLPFVEKMEKGNPRDPLLMQVLPQGIELVQQNGFTSDPLAESRYIPVEGLIHKYHGRVLIVSSGICAVNCRFCFRRHFAYGDHQLKGAGLQSICDYISKDSSIKEVILSGGDPLVLSDRRLGKILAAVSMVPHVTTLRIHTRLPLMIPQRITAGLIKAITASRLQVVMVIHCNHANEIDENVTQAFSLLKRADITLLSQAVLLKGVNDNVKTLRTLHEKLFQAGVIPYYLHILDKVQGAAHFDIDEQTAISLVRHLRAESPGYLVPRLVREVADSSSKVPLCF